MKDNYFTLKEILSQPEIWDKVEEEVGKIKEDLNIIFSYKDYEKIIFTGFGSSYYLAIAADKVFSYLTGKSSLALPPSELVLYPQIYLRREANYRLIPISRSGESTETVDALLKIKRNYKARILGVSCYRESTLVKNSDLSIVVPQAKEESVVMTRSFTTMLLALWLSFSIVAGEDKFFRELQRLPNLGRQIIGNYKDLCREVIEESKCDKFVYLGSGPFYGLACEGALKMKEMANLPTEVYHLLEYMHGPKSTADEKTMVFLLLPEQINDYISKFIKELTSLGVKFLIECEKITPGLRHKNGYIVEIKSGLSDFSRGLLYMPILQLVAFYNTLRRNLNPDSPRNLTQVVQY